MAEADGTGDAETASAGNSADNDGNLIRRSTAEHSPKTVEYAAASVIYGAAALFSMAVPFSAVRGGRLDDSATAGKLAIPVAAVAAWRNLADGMPIAGCIFERTPGIVPSGLDETQGIAVPALNSTASVRAADRGSPGQTTPRQLTGETRRSPTHSSFFR